MDAILAGCLEAEGKDGGRGFERVAMTPPARGDVVADLEDIDVTDRLPGQPTVPDKTAVEASMTQRPKPKRR